MTFLGHIVYNRNEKMCVSCRVLQIGVRNTCELNVRRGEGGALPEFLLHLLNANEVVQVALLGRGER